MIFASTDSTLAVDYLVDLRVNRITLRRVNRITLRPFSVSIVSPFRVNRITHMMAKAFIYKASRGPTNKYTNKIYKQDLVTKGYFLWITKAFSLDLQPLLGVSPLPALPALRAAGIPQKCQALHAASTLTGATSGRLISAFGAGLAVRRRCLQKACIAGLVPAHNVRCMAFGHMWCTYHYVVIIELERWPESRATPVQKCVF